MNNKQELIVAPTQPQGQKPSGSGVMEKLLGAMNLQKTVPEMLAHAAQANEPLTVTIEQKDGALRVSHKPHTPDSRREIVVKIESDN